MYARKAAVGISICLFIMNTFLNTYITTYWSSNSSIPSWKKKILRSDWALRLKMLRMKLKISLFFFSLQVRSQRWIRIREWKSQDDSHVEEHRHFWNRPDGPLDRFGYSHVHSGIRWYVDISLFSTFFYVPPKTLILAPGPYSPSAISSFTSLHLSLRWDSGIWPAGRGSRTE